MPTQTHWLNLDTQTLSIAVSAALAITTPSIRKCCTLYPIGLAMPTGLTLDPSTGPITGTPRQGRKEHHNLTFTVQDLSTATPQPDSKAALS